LQSLRKYFLYLAHGYGLVRGGTWTAQRNVWPIYVNLSLQTLKKERVKF